jgi:hypothetical protein
MFNNFTNINKTKNYLSSQTIEHKKTMTYDVGDPGTCDRHNNVVGLKYLVKCQPSTSDNWIGINFTKFCFND